MFSYPVDLIPDEDVILVSFPDLPWVHTFGDDQDEALARASDALESGFMVIIADRADIPIPSPVRAGQHLVGLPALAAAKVALYQAMRAAGLRKVDLARRMGVHLPQVDRLLDLRHASRLEHLEAALAAVGKRLVVEIRDAA